VARHRLGDRAAFPGAAAEGGVGLPSLAERWELQCRPDRINSKTEPQQVHLKALASGKHDAATGFSITYSAPDTDGTDNLLESSALAATRF